MPSSWIRRAVVSFPPCFCRRITLRRPSTWWSRILWSPRRVWTQYPRAVSLNRIASGAPVSAESLRSAALWALGGASARQSMPGRARSLACLNLRFGRLIACIARKLVVFNRASGDTGSYHFRGVTKMGINWSFVCFARDFCPLNNFGEVLPSSVSHGFH